MKSTLKQSIRSIVKVEWSQFETLAALRCTIGVAVPLVTGLVIGQPQMGVFGAAGAIGVGFASFQGAYLGRAAVMLLAAIAMACSVFVGSVAGSSTLATIAVAALWAFAGGFLVALGQGASVVGLQSIIVLLIAGGFPTDFEGAAGRAALVFGGGVVQTILVVVVWPLRRFVVERKSLAAVYRSLAEYASTIPARRMSPEPHTFAGTPSPLDDPQPFARSGEVFFFQGLLDEAERIRASLAAFAIHYARLKEEDQACTSALPHLAAQALAEIADALEEGREPRERPGFSEELTSCLGRQSSNAVVNSVLQQIRAAWRTAGVPTAVPGHLAPRRELGPLRRRRPLLEGLITLRANLTMGSTACRHALRLAAILTVALAGARFLELPRGFWLPLTIALVLKPDFHDTFAFSVQRMAGTVLGAAGATAIALVVAPEPALLVVFLLVSVWGAYGFGIANFSAASVCFTAYVVFLMTFVGVPEASAAADRIIYTVIGGLLALGAYAAWPTWAATAVRPTLAAVLAAQSRYLGALLTAYAPGSQPDLKELDEIRASARLARSNFEAVVGRMGVEPHLRYAMTPRTAEGIVAANRRNALAALALHAGLERDMSAAVPGIGDLGSRVSLNLLTLEAAARARSAPAPLTEFRETPVADATGAGCAVRDETDLIIDSIETIAELLAKDAGSAPTEHAPTKRQHQVTN